MSLAQRLLDFAVAVAADIKSAFAQLVRRDHSNLNELYDFQLGQGTTFPVNTTDHGPGKLPLENLDLWLADNGAHAGNRANPHQTTAAQVGAAGIGSVNTFTAVQKIDLTGSNPTPHASATLYLAKNGAPGTSVNVDSYGATTQLMMRSTGGTASAQTTTINGKYIYNITAYGHNGTGFTSFPPAQIAAIATEDWSSTANGAKLQIRLTRNGTAIGYTAFDVEPRKIAPGEDGVSQLGDASRRFSEFFAASGTINTSDAREKTAIRELSSAEINAAKQLAAEIGIFRWLSAVEQKGDRAREHAGMTVQRAMEIMTAAGLDPLRYGFICHDVWPERIEDEWWGTRIIKPPVINDEGVEIEKAVTEPYLINPKREFPAGERYGFRADQLLLFMVRGIEARLKVIEDGLRCN